MNWWTGKKAAVAGGSGMLGRDLAACLAQQGAEVAVWTRALCDARDPDACRRALALSKAVAVFNCAAFTDVNGAETRRDEAWAVNANGAGNLAAACGEAGIPCVYVSTDYVFDGTKSLPYNEDDTVCPINAYGASKLEGERQTAARAPRHAIVRTSWLYGLGGKNFVTTMLDAARAGRDLRVVADQTGAPTYTRDLAAALVALVEAGGVGIFHATNSGSCTWHEFASEIFRQAGIQPKSLVAVASSEIPSPARRPANSRLGMDRLAEARVPALPSWQDALSRFLAEVRSPALHQ